MTNTDSDKLAVKDLELLTCSAGDYAKSQGRELTAYELIEIETMGAGYGSPRDDFKFQARQRSCEVVVDVRYSQLRDYCQIAGTGLRLRKNEP